MISEDMQVSRSRAYHVRNVHEHLMHEMIKAHSSTFHLRGDDVRKGLNYHMKMGLKPRMTFHFVSDFLFYLSNSFHLFFFFKKK